jgi:hypothetical protein
MRSLAHGMSVGWEFVPPKPAADFSDLVAPLMAKRMRENQMRIIPIAEHLKRLNCRLLKEVDCRDIIVVHPVKRRRWFELANPPFGSSVGYKRSLEAVLQFRLIQVPCLVKDCPEADANCAPLTSPCIGHSAGM